MTLTAFKSPLADVLSYTSPLPTPTPETGGGLPTPASSTSEPALVLAMRAEPEGVAPGEVVTFTLMLSNASSDLAKGLVVSATVPDGLQWILGQPGWTFDAATKRVQANVRDLAPSAGMTLTLPLRAAELADTLATLMVEATCDGTTCASGRASVYVAYPTRATIGPGGGTLASSDNRVRVEFPVGAVSQSVEVRYRPTRVKALSPQVHGQSMAFQFDLDALASDRAVTQFAQPLTLTVSLNGLIDLNNLPEGMYAFLAYLTSEGTWQHLDPPYYVNRQAGTISARVDHFTGYGAGVTDPRVWSQAYNPPHANLFGGAASFEIPIEAPAGRNGLQPKLALSYNSRRMDGRDGGTYSRLGPLPDGWSLSVMDIEREKWWWCDWGTDYANGPCTTDVFSLIMNGTTYELYGSPGQEKGRYYAKDAPELYVLRVNDLCTPAAPCDGYTSGAPNTTGEYWIVRLPDGTEVRFGYVANAELLTTGICPFNQWGWGSSDCRGPYNPSHPYFGRLDTHDPRTAVRRWQADTMTDRSGNTITFTYAEEADGDPGNARSTLRAISYNGGLTQIALPGPGGLEPKINAIYITNTNNLGNLVTVRWYELGWGTTSQTFPGSCDMDPYVFPILSSVQQVSGDNSKRLPLQTFGYTKFQSGPNEDGCNIYMPRLTTVNNGYGAQTTITYEDSGDRETGYSWRVQRITNTGGVSGSPAMVSTYAYGTPCYDRWVTDDYGYTWHTGPCTSRAAVLNGKDVKGPLVGHDWVTESQGDGTNVLARSTHWFNVGDSRLLGRETQAQHQDGAGTLLRQQNTTWTYGSFGGGVTTFAYATSETTSEYSVGAVVASRRTDYIYDTQYGNLLTTTEYADGGGTLYRQTERSYALNTSQWIVNKPSYEKVYHWAGSWVQDAWTAYRYDYKAANDAAMGNQGHLTAVRRWNGALFADTRYTYDSWGNRTSETTYTDYGTSGAFASVSPMTTTFGYDSQYHLYTESITNTKGQVTAYSYNKSLGVVASVTDPNNAVTSYDYDLFGRLKKIARPDDSLSYPTEEYGYYDGGDQVLTDRWPLVVMHWVRGTAGLNWCSGGSGSWERTFYDGLGRQVEHQTPGLNWICDGNGQEVVSYTLYDALGRATVASVPYTVTQYVSATTPDGRVVTSYKGPVLLADFESGVDSRGSLAAQGGMTFGGPAYAWETPYTPAGDDINYWDVYSNGDGQNNYVDYYLNFTSQDWRGFDTLRVKFYTWCDGGCNGNRKIRVYIHDADGTGNSDGNGYHYLGDWTDGTVNLNFAGATNRDQINQVLVRVYESFFGGVSVVNARQRTHLYSIELDHSAAIGAAKTQTTFDALGRITQVTAPDGTATRTFYRGWQTAMIDANSHQKISTADAFGRLVTVQEYDGTYSSVNWTAAPYATTQYAYNVLDNLTGVTDALTNTTVITYNVLGRKVGMRDPDMGVWGYEYDVAGNLITQTDMLNQKVWFKYDALNRLLEKRVGGSTGTLLASYGYDTGTNGKGRRTVMTDTTGSASWAYDARGRVLTDTKVISGTGTFNTYFQYDAMDRVITMTYPTGEVVTQTYNIAAPRSVTQVRSATHNVAYASGLTYNPPGQLTQMRLGNNLLITNTYDLLSFRLKRLQAGSLLDLSYRYDAVGNVQAITDTTNSSQVQTFTYDALDRLTSASTTLIGTGQYAESYQYNPIGNITYTSRLGNYSYPASGLNSVRPHAATLAGSNSYSYDVNGNMTRRVELSGTQRMTYTQAWDIENRLSVVTNTTTMSVTRFYYDGDGKRVKKTDPSGTTIYVGNPYEQFTPAQSGVNVAQGKLATQSSTYGGFAVASRAVDGNTSGNWNDGSTTHTNYDAQAWWQVDLGNVQPIQSLTLWNRTDCCGDRLSNFYVLVSDHPFVSTDLNTARNQAGVSSYYIASVGTNTSVTVNRTGRYVRVQLVGTNYLSLAEVQVWNGPLATSYYYAGSTRVALRQGSAIYYLQADHLGSASLTTDANGNKYTEERYYPYGDTRSGSSPTDYQFTGQRREATLGSLYDYGARFYSSYLNRFLSADTIVPSPGNPQSLNRYSYVLNSPVMYQDPTGHAEQCFDSVCTNHTLYGINFTADKGQYWDTNDAREVYGAAGAIATRMASMRTAQNIGVHRRNPREVPLKAYSPEEMFTQAFGTVTFNRNAGNCEGGTCWGYANHPVNGTIQVYAQNVGHGHYTAQNAAHELGHIFDRRTGDQARANLATANITYVNERGRINTITTGVNRIQDGFATQGDMPTTWQQNPARKSGEEFADMFLGWAYNHFANNAAGAARFHWMSTNMAEWIAQASR